jgi:putative transcriptional regulator
MSPSVHPELALLSAYAAGTTPEAVSLAVACHLSLCGRCRATVDGLDAVGGAMLGDGRAEMSPGALEAVLSRLDQPGPPAPARPPVPAWASHLPVPGPLRPYLEQSPRWQRPVPGVRQVGLPLAHGGTPVRLVELRAGFEVPLHGHEGAELNLVLQGGYDDLGSDETFLPGDLSVRSADVEHGIRAHDDGPCTVLVVLEGRLLPRTLLGHVAAWVSGF